MSQSSPELLAIIEIGGYPNFLPLYERLGYQVTVVNSQRKARNYLKKNQPDVIVCEYNFQSDFRDRTSNLETLMAVLQKQSGVNVVVFYQQEHEAKLDKLAGRFEISHRLPFPVDEQQLESALEVMA